MFIGHYSAAFIAATHPKAPSLPVLVAAAQFVDILFFLFIMIGLEKMGISPGITAMNPMDLYQMPITHSLFGSAGLAVLFGAVVYFTRYSFQAALLAGAVVVSHWFLDLLVHAPDLTIAGQPPKLGLGLWNYPAIEMPLELALTFGTLWYLVRKNQLENRRTQLIAFAGTLLLLQLFNWFAPAPTEMSAALPLSGLFAFFLAIGLAWWLERRSRARA
jgi:hypothetical protein